MLSSIRMSQTHEGGGLSVASFAHSSASTPDRLQVTASSIYDGSIHDDCFEGYAKIEISVKCRKLKRMDLMSSTDAFCVVHISEGDDSSCLRDRVSKLPSMCSKELGRTEVVKNNLNPDFATTFKTNFVFEEQQTLIVRVYDEDKRGVADLKKHEFIGAVSIRLGQLMSSKGNTVRLPLDRKRGFVIIQAEEIATCNDQLIIKFRGSDLLNRDGKFGKSDPFVVISRMNTDADYSRVWNSEVIMNNLNPEWKLSRISVQRICNADLDRPIRIQLFDWQKNGSHREMGVVNTTVRSLLKNPSFGVTHDGKPAGNLSVTRAEIIKIPTVIEYMSGTCEINFIAAIDFSASNGPITKTNSLHFMDHRGFANEYQAALSTVGSILQDYGAARKTPLCGFGAKIGGTSEHFFQALDPEGQNGLEAMLDAYISTFHAPGFAMGEPTLLAPTVRAAADMAKEYAESNDQAYTILLIITDGEINDVDQTVDEIIEAAEAPLSIIIVGVGDGDFTDMTRLDADMEDLVSSTGKVASRDIVQFVPFRKYSKSVSRLTAETLEEIPFQLVNYFWSKGVKPMPLIPVATALGDDDIDEYPSAALVEDLSDNSDANNA